MSLARRILGRGEQPPTEATDHLERDERVISWGRTEDGRAVVATQRGLWLPAGADYRRIGWHEITKLSWSEAQLTIVEGKPFGDGEFIEDARPQSWAVTEPRDLPKVMRARVEHSVEVTEHHELRPSGGVRIVGRRISGQDGLSWVARFDPGTQWRDPGIAEQVSALLAEVRTRHAPRTDL